MKYQYVKAKENYEHLSSGKILYSLPGQSAFPVRLSSEIVQRCFAILEANDNQGPYTLYDPCCGSGYLLTTLGFTHGNRLKKIYASDVDIQAVNLAEKNLKLLYLEGINQRIKHLEMLADAYHKNSHREALIGAEKLKAKCAFLQKLEIECFQEDMTCSAEIKQLAEVDIIIADLSYGKLAHWKTKEKNPVPLFFEKISKILKPFKTVLVVISNEKQKTLSPELLKISHFKMGHRMITFFQKN